MSSLAEYNQVIPNSTAPKGGDFIHFDPFTDDGLTILTILGVKFLKDYEQFNKEKNVLEVFDAYEFILGAKTTQGPRFLRPRPMKASIHEKATYYAFFKAATGKPPVQGTNAKALIGKGVTGDLVTEEKTSKKGTKYVRTTCKGWSAVHPKLLAEITPAADLYPALELALTPKDKGASKPITSTPPDEDAPF